MCVWGGVYWNVRCIDKLEKGRERGGKCGVHKSSCRRVSSGSQACFSHLFVLRVKTTFLFCHFSRLKGGNGNNESSCELNRNIDTVQQTHTAAVVQGHSISTGPPPGF